MVCAGIQKRGIVFLNTNCHCTFQLSEPSILPKGMGVMRALGLPPQLRMWVCDFVQGHEYGAEGGVHHEADEECPQEVARGESFLCGVYEVSEPEAGHEPGYS